MPQIPPGGQLLPHRRQPIPVDDGVGGVEPHRGAPEPQGSGERQAGARRQELGTEEAEILRWSWPIPVDERASSLASHAPDKRASRWPPMPQIPPGGQLLPHRRQPIPVDDGVGGVEPHRGAPEPQGSGERQRGGRSSEPKKPSSDLAGKRASSLASHAPDTTGHLHTVVNRSRLTTVWEELNPTVALPSLRARERGSEEAGARNRRSRAPTWPVRGPPRWPPMPQIPPGGQLLPHRRQPIPVDDGVEELNPTGRP